MKTTGKRVGGGRTVSAVAFALVLGIQAWAVDPATSTNLPAQSTIWGPTNSPAPPLQTSVPAFPIGGTNDAPRAGSPNLPGATVAMLGSMAFSQSLTNSPPADLIVWWVFGEGNGTNVEDASGNGNNGGLLGDPLPTWANGVTSGALTFDGSQNYVQSDHAFNQTISAFTIEAWFSAVSASGQNPAIISTLGDDIGFNSLADIVIYTNSVYNGHNSIGLDLHWGDLLLAPVGLIDGNWHHVAGVWDGTTSSLYVDGQLVATQSDVHAAFTWTTPLRLAYRDTNGGCNYGGDIGEVRIYSRALSGDEVATNYNADTIGDGIPDWWRLRYFGSGTTTDSVSCATCDPNGNGVNNQQEYNQGTNPLLPSGLTMPTNLIAWWMFDEGTGAFVGDVSGNGHCGVLLGNSPPTWTNGVTSGALTFDGFQNYVQTELPFHETISAYTIEAWFSAVSAYGQNPAIISTLGNDIGFNSLADIVIYYTNSTYNGHNSIGLDMHWGDLLLAYMGLFDGNWHQVTGTWDGSNSTLYVDGQMVATQPDVHDVFSWTTPLRLAYRDTNGGCNFGGDIGEIRIYDQALSSNEVLASYNTSTVGDGIPNWWRQEYFGIGTTTNDQTCASCTYTNSGLDNLQAYDCGLDPLVPIVITTPTSVYSGMLSNRASIPEAGAGVSYTWSITNGTITAGQNTTNITWTAGSPGTATVCVALSGSPSCSNSICTTVPVTPAYYIDYQHGSDLNDGTNPTIAWMHCPGDANAGGNASTTLLPGDTVFFKGGVQYVLTDSPSLGSKIGNPGIVLASGGASSPIVYDGYTWGATNAIITDNYGNGGSNSFYAFGVPCCGGSANWVIRGFNVGPIGGMASLPSYVETNLTPSYTASSTNPATSTIYILNDGGTGSGEELWGTTGYVQFQLQNQSSITYHCTAISPQGSIWSGIQYTNTVGPTGTLPLPFAVSSNNGTAWVNIGTYATNAYGSFGGAIVLTMDNGQILTNATTLRVTPGSYAWGFESWGPISNATIQNCNFYQIGLWTNTYPIGQYSIQGKGIAPIGYGAAIDYNFRIVSNTFTKMEHSIDFGFNSLTNVEIAYNNIHDYTCWGIVLSPANAQFLYGLHVHNNTIYNVGDAYATDNANYYGSTNTGYHQDYIFLDCASPFVGSDIDIYNNYFYDTFPPGGAATGLIFLSGGVGPNIYNNIFNCPFTQLNGCIQINEAAVGQNVSNPVDLLYRQQHLHQKRQLRTLDRPRG